MNDPRLVEVGARLEKIVSESCYPHHPPSSEELFDCIEMVAIQILDSQYQDFREGELLSYLQKFLKAKRKQLGLPD